MVVHLGVEVFGAGQLAEVSNTGGTTTLLASRHLVGECSFLWKDELQADRLGSTESLSLCTLPAILLNTPLVLQVHAWLRK